MHRWDYVLDVEEINCLETKRIVQSVLQKLKNITRGIERNTQSSSGDTLMHIINLCISRERKLECACDVESANLYSMICDVEFVKKK